MYVDAQTRHHIKRNLRAGDSRTRVVANQGTRSKPNSVSALDTKDSKVIAAVPVGKGPNGISITP